MRIHPSVRSGLIGGWLLVFSGLWGAGSQVLWAQGDEECLACHEDETLEGERSGRTISVYVNPEVFAASVHKDLGCTSCHVDLDGVELPHDEDVEPVDCAACHDDVKEELLQGPHGKWPEDAAQPAAACVRCHGSHDILPVRDPGAPVHPANAEDLCGQCHRNEVAAVERGAHGKQGQRVPAASCVQCHRGHDVSKPRDEKAELEICVACHPREVSEQRRSVHARAALRNDPLAPTCITCHEHHEILPKTDPRSPTAVMNVPLLCGRCHREGSAVSLQRDIPQDRILENYSMSIHGEGLFRKGLTVTAVCSSCHNAHLILEHSHPDSSINPVNVARTCMRCHARIEEVHVKVIEGRLWEEEPHKIPACIDCHQPHKIRRTPVSPERVANRECLQCHGDPNLAVTRDGRRVSLFIDEAQYAASSHANTACAQCHTEVSSALKRPCAAIQNRVDCAVCHAEVVQEWQESAHGRFAAEGDPAAPTCRTCHDPHYTLSSRLPTSPTFPRNVPQLCGQCHKAGGQAAVRIRSDIPDIVDSYVHSVHGRGVLEAGLVVSATCADCHTAHHELPKTDPRSSVHPRKLADTCGTCHKGIEEEFKTSIHWPGNGARDLERLPTCEDCHTSHQIQRTDVVGFRQMMIEQCGRCHEPEAETYFETVHGKVSRLGEEGAAKCYDCHGTHNILPPEDPRSTLSHDNVVQTCATCHPGAHRQFAGYLTHATHHDPEKYPYLYYAFVFMTALLIGTLSFFVLHTLLWLWRLWRTREIWRVHRAAPKERFYVRFNLVQRLMHAVMIVSFFTLAITGMALKFSYAGWAVLVAQALGGFAVTSVLHRGAAVVLMALFGFHVYQLVRCKRRSGKSWLEFIFAPDSLMFNLEDLRQFWASVKWFFGKGERPKFGRWTYWEKFDYFAVFWGVFVIGSTGLILWFPEFFTRFLPGWTINVATIVHSDEALLAVAFIFTIHFFNTHFRPDKFPMDPVIFTGRVPLEELQHDKPAEYEALVSSPEWEKRLAGPISKDRLLLIKIFGFTALTIGLTLIALIIYAMLYVYR
ncbi:MAG: hypothetical protein Kow00109_22720 [Acidobacteriota bacterium]